MPSAITISTGRMHSGFHEQEDNPMSTVDDTIWQRSDVVNRFLNGTRGALPCADTQLDVMVRILRTMDRPVRSFLDLGCGNGILSASILDAWPDARGVLVDFSAPMLEAAQQDLAAYSNVTCHTLDYGDPQWVSRIADQAPFDAIVSGFSIHHQPDERKRAIYAECFGLLKPGGWFINMEHIQAATKLSTDLFANHLADNQIVQERRTGGSRTRQDILDEFANRVDDAANILAPVEVQCEWLRDVGYEEVDCFFRIYELAIFGGRKP
jgi:tRNA (cmo5U34)-methyltransferase